MPASTATRPTIARPGRPAKNCGGRPPTPQTLATEAVAEAHAYLDRAGAELVSDLHVLSQRIYACQTREEILAHIHSAASHFTDRIVRMKSRLREINREISGIAA
jgi:hypothetical protein